MRITAARKRRGDLSVNLVQVIRCKLIYIVVEPVAVKQIAVRPPFQKRLLFRVIVREIVDRDRRSKPLSGVSCLLVAQCVAVIFRMSHNEDPSSVP